MLLPQSAYGSEGVANFNVMMMMMMVMMMMMIMIMIMIMIMTFVSIEQRPDWGGHVSMLYT